MSEVKFVLKLMKDELIFNVVVVCGKEFCFDEGNLIGDFFYWFFECKFLERVVVN